MRGTAPKSALLGIILASCLAGVALAADLRLARLFGDHMVLQREMPVPVWGWAEPGERIEVSLGDHGARAQAEADGKWTATLPPLKAGGPHRLIVTGQLGSRCVEDVLVGDVWLCSGQSNMQFTVRAAQNADAEIAAARYPSLRLLNLWPKPPVDTPAADFHGDPVWHPCSPENVRGFSAVGYFFGRELQKELKVPIGMVEAAVGGTPIESWTSRRKLAEDPETARVLALWEAIRPRISPKEQEYAQRLAAWQRAARETAGKGQTPFPRPKADLFVLPERRPAALFNVLIHPLAPMAMRGVIWYQGESGGEPYGKLLKGLIEDWRALWGRDDLPFCVGQLHNVGPVQTDPNEKDAWNRRREAQLRVAKEVPKVGVTVSIDLGIPDDTHYPNKQEVGRRMALWALAKVYGQSIPYSGPVYRKMAVEGSAVRLEFDHVEGGLVAKDGQLRGFVIAGEDRKFVFADARIDGPAVLVRSPGVPRPVAVRYGWAINPVCTLYNAAGLPAAPFRTDDW